MVVTLQILEETMGQVGLTFCHAKLANDVNLIKRTPK